MKGKMISLAIGALIGTVISVYAANQRASAEEQPVREYPIGTPVVKLKREKFAFLTLGNLNPGEYRELTKQEVKWLRVLAETGKLDLH